MPRRTPGDFLDDRSDPVKKKQKPNVLSTDPLRASNSRFLVDWKERMSCPVDDSFKSSRARSTGLNFFMTSVLCGELLIWGDGSHVWRCARFPLVLNFIQHG